MKKLLLLCLAVVVVAAGARYMLFPQDSALIVEEEGLPGGAPDPWEGVLPLTKQPDPAELVFGETTRDEIRERFGKPLRIETLTMGDYEVELLYFATLGGESIFDETEAARLAYFYFLDGKLIGHEYSSTVKEDATFFEAGQAQQIRKGMRREEVLQAMGPPHGAYRYPLIEEQDGEAMVYFYFEDRDWEFQNRLLLAVADPKGQIVRTRFSSTDGDAVE
jgi:hypothetical protein